MNSQFDPYYQWLGISPYERPINHYRLLDLPLFTNDAQAIQAAADEKMRHVRTFQSGRRANESQQLLNEIAAAKTCLLDADTKATYDAVLHGQLAATAGTPAPPVTSLANSNPPPVAPPTAPTRPAVTRAVVSEPSWEKESDDSFTPFYFQPWFPVLVVAGVLLAGLGVWGARIGDRRRTTGSGAGSRRNFAVGQRRRSRWANACGRRSQPRRRGNHAGGRRQRFACG